MFLAASLLWGGAADAHRLKPEVGDVPGTMMVRAGNLAIMSPHVTLTPGETSIPGIELVVMNLGKNDDRLTAASTPIADGIDFRQAQRAATTIALPAGGAIKLDGDLTALWFRGLNRPLREGDVFPLRLRFEQAGEVEMTVKVRAYDTSGPHDHK